MKQSELRRALVEEFGVAYAGVLLRDHWLPKLQKTGSDALAAGTEPRVVWEAICEEFQVPEARRHGRGLLDPKR